MNKNRMLYRQMADDVGKLLIFWRSEPILGSNIRKEGLLLLQLIERPAVGCLLSLFGVYNDTIKYNRPT